MSAMQCVSDSCVSFFTALFRAPDSTQLNWLSWVGRSELALSRIMSKEMEPQIRN